MIVHVLRSISGNGRQLIAVEGGSGDEAERDEKINDLEADEEIEGWIHWKRRTIREALEAIKNFAVSDWADEGKRGFWRFCRWAGPFARNTELDAIWLERCGPSAA